MRKKPSLQPLEALLKEKQEILRDLLHLTLKQKEMLEAPEEMNQEAFLTCVEERGRMMETVDELDVRFLDLMRAIKKEMGLESLDQASAGTFKPEEVKALQALTMEIQKQMKMLTEQDLENREKMKVAMNHVKGEIGQIQKGKKAIHGYANTKQKQPSLFLDKKEKNK